jgi:hypothetical protein
MIVLGVGIFLLLFGLFCGLSIIDKGQKNYRYRRIVPSAKTNGDA